MSSSKILNGRIVYIFSYIVNFLFLFSIIAYSMLTLFVSADEWWRPWSVSFSWRREHFCLDWHNWGWERNCVRGFILQTLFALSSGLPFQATPSEVWDNVLPSKCWSIWQYLSWHSSGIHVPALVILVNFVLTKKIQLQKWKKDICLKFSHNIDQPPYNLLKILVLS